MRIAIMIENNGWRDVLREMIERLEAEGHEVTVFRGCNAHAPFGEERSCPLEGSDEQDKAALREEQRLLDEDNPASCLPLAPDTPSQGRSR